MRFCESSPVQCPVAVFELVLGPAGDIRVVSVSAALLEILQLDIADASNLSKSLMDLIHPDDRTAFEQTLVSAAENFKMVAWEARLQTKVLLKSVRIELHPVNTSNQESRWTGVIQDLTDIKELQDRFESVLEAAQAFTWRRDLRLGLSQFGTRWARFAGHRGGESSMRHVDWLAVVHPDDQTRVRIAVEALERGEVQHQTLLYRRRLVDGSWVWLRVHAGISERDQDGTPVALSGVSFDVTNEIETLHDSQSESNMLRDKLEKTKEILQKTAYDLTENIPVGTYTMYLEPGASVAKFGFMSRRFLEITGLSADRARADTMEAFACIHPEDYNDWVHKNVYAFVNRLPFREEARVCVDGEVKWIVAESAPRLTEEGTWIWEGVIQDITAQKTSEIALRGAQKMLLDLAQQRAGIAERQRLLRDIHDGFGNTLAIGKIRLRTGELSASATIDVLDDCLDDLRLTISSLDSEGDSLWNVLAAQLERLSTRIRHTPTALSWNIDAAKGIFLKPREMLDVGRIVQEAVSNSIRHAQASAITVNVHDSSRVPQIEIQDDGRGIEPEVKQSGNGLRNMHARAERNGWHLEVRSGATGTTISIRFDNVEPQKRATKSHIDDNSLF